MRGTSPSAFLSPPDIVEIWWGFYLWCVRQFALNIPNVWFRSVHDLTVKYGSALTCLIWSTPKDLICFASIAITKNKWPANYCLNVAARTRRYIASDPGLPWASRARRCNTFSLIVYLKLMNTSKAYAVYSVVVYYLPCEWYYSELFRWCERPLDDPSPARQIGWLLDLRCSVFCPLPQRDRIMLGGGPISEA